MLLQAVCLDSQNSVAVRRAKGGIMVDEGVHVDPAGQLGILHRQIEIVFDAMTASRGVKIAHAAVMEQALQIKFNGEQPPTYERTGGANERAGLVKQALAAVHAVRSGFAHCA